MPVLYSPDGTRYRTEEPSEVSRLKANGYSEEAPENRVTFADTLFHPADHSVEDVLTYIAENPADADRVIAEEKAVKARVTILGKPDAAS
jgi:hypothetical protein